MVAEGLETAAAPPQRDRPVWLGRVGLVALAVGLGVYADRGQLAPSPLSLIPQLGAPWMLLAFGWGRCAGGRALSGALLGVLAVLVGLASYIAFKSWAYGYHSVDQLLRYQGSLWVTAAVVVGSCCGVAGAWSTTTGRSRPAASFGWLVGGLCAEAAWIPYAWGVPGSRVLSWVELLAAVGVLAVGVRRCGAARMAAASVAFAAVGLLAAYVFFFVF